VTVASIAPPKRRLYTAGELATRWGLSESRALEWLLQFERTGYVERRGDCWQASAKAHALHLVDMDGEPL
jgi:DNA-binding IclR family transcriptional regulator